MKYGMIESLFLLTSPRVLLLVIIVLIVVFIVKYSSKKKATREPKEQPRVGYQMNNTQTGKHVSDRAEKKRRYCSHCGATLDDGAKFCSECGEEVV